MSSGNNSPTRKVTLCRGAQIRKQRQVSVLVMEAWGTLQHFNEANRRAKESAAHE